MASVTKIVHEPRTPQRDGSLSVVERAQWDDGTETTDALRLPAGTDFQLLASRRISALEAARADFDARQGERAIHESMRTKVLAGLVGATDVQLTTQFGLTRAEIDDLRARREL